MAKHQGCASVTAGRGRISIWAQSVFLGRWEGPFWVGAVRIGMPDIYGAVVEDIEPDRVVGMHLRKALEAAEVGKTFEDYGIAEDEKHPWGDPKPRRERQAADLGVRVKDLSAAMEKKVPVEWMGETVTLTPTKKRRRRFWQFDEDEVGHEDVVVPWLSSDEELGQALRLALARCD